MKHIKTFELNDSTKLYLLKKDWKYFLINKKLRNKFLPENWFYEDIDNTIFYLKKDIDNTNYLVIELSGVTLYFSEDWKNYKPKNSIELTKKALLDTISWFVNNLWLFPIFNSNTKKISNYTKNNNINYKK